MIFNKDNKGNEELRRFTGSYYASNNFEKVKLDIDLAAEEIIKLIGLATYNRAETYYHSNAITDNADSKLVECIQAPIALLATLRMYQKNGVSHEDSGRKVKIDDQSEKMPWEWMLNRDDQVHLEDYYRACDRLIRYLDTTTAITEWAASDQKKMRANLLINKAELFDRYLPIDGSCRLYAVLLPFVSEAEKKHLKKALGTEYARLLALSEASGNDKILLDEYVYPPIPLMAMSIALRRMPLSLLPFGVVQRIVSSSQTATAADKPDLKTIDAVANWMWDDAMVMVNEMKIHINGRVDLDILPANDVNNKFVRV